MVSSTSKVTDGIRLTGSLPLYTLEAGTYVDVVSIEYVELDQRIRGRLADGGWISIVATGDEQFAGLVNNRFAIPVPVGAYHTTAPLEAGPGWENRIRDGEYVEVVQTKYFAEIKSLRGRLHDGRWIPILDENCRWARPHALGAYRTTADAVGVSDGMGQSSKQWYTLKAGTFLDIVETHFLEEENKVRGRIAGSQAWVTLVDTRTGSTWAESPELCEYMTVVHTGVSDCMRKSSARGLYDMVAGIPFHIVETRYVKEDNRVRGRLAGRGLDIGNWVSLVNTLDGHHWALPRKQAEEVIAKAEKMRAEQSTTDIARDILLQAATAEKANRTCNVCGDVFKTPRARWQHFEAVHDLHQPRTHRKGIVSDVRDTVNGVSDEVPMVQIDLF